jgi:hypothetical protein
LGSSRRTQHAPKLNGGAGAADRAKSCNGKHQEAERGGGADSPGAGKTWARVYGGVQFGKGRAAVVPGGGGAVNCRLLRG